VQGLVDLVRADELNLHFVQLACRGVHLAARVSQEFVELIE
jgi:hypothetical protein